METVVLTIHVIIVLALIGVVLLQRSEGGALGMGAGSGGGFMTGRGAANALTRTTSILAALFFATSLGLAFFAGTDGSDLDAAERLTGEEIRDPSAPLTADDLFDTLGSDDDEEVGAEPEALSLDADAQSDLEKALDSLGVDADAIDPAADAVSEVPSAEPEASEEPEEQ